jgi:excisionase family DNA binding protein
MKFNTGKPPRKRITKPKLTIADLTPLDQMPSNCTMRETCAYLRLSMPTVYAMVKRGQLESVVIGGKRTIRPGSIKRVLEGNHEIPKRAPKFVCIRKVPNAKAA